MEAPAEKMKNDAETLYKDGKFEQALPLYKNLWEQHQNECNEWIGYHYAHCYYKLKQYDKARLIFKNLHQKYPNFEIAKNLLAWCIYYVEIVPNTTDKNNNAIDENILFKAGEEITKITKQIDLTNTTSPCVYTITVFKIISYLKNNNNYQQILYWLNKLNPNFLSTVPQNLTNKNDLKAKELSSQKENWFTHRVKALYYTNNFKECLSTAETALHLIKQFHYDNDIWLTRYIALSKEKLGDINGAIDLLKKIEQSKHDWFIQNEIALCYKNINKIDEALFYAASAALNDGEIAKKVNVFKLLSELLKEKGNDNNARKHVELIYRIRIDNNWNIDKNTMDMLSRYSINTATVPMLHELINDLTPLWESLKFNSKQKREGVIKKILEDSKSGFITTNDGQSYYFHTKDVKGKKSNIKQGQKVQFYIEDSFDKKKNKPSKIAVFIKPLE